MKKTSVICIIILLSSFAGLFQAFDNGEDLNFNAWTPVHTFGSAPSNRTAAATAVFGNQIWTFAGFREVLIFADPLDNIFYNDLHAFDVHLRTWFAITPANAGPSVRTFALGVNYNDAFVVGFGTTYTKFFYDWSPIADLWSFNRHDLEWTLLWQYEGTNGPSPRASFAYALDSNSQRLFIFGGVGASLYDGLDETWFYNFHHNSWTQITSTPFPSQREGPIATGGFAPFVGGVMYSYSGETVPDATIPTDLFWQLDFYSNQWIQLPTPTLAPRNNGNGAAFINNKLWIVGGDVGGGGCADVIIFPQNNCNQTWSYDVVRNQWQEQFPEPNIAPLKRGSTLLVGSVLYVIHGFIFTNNNCRFDYNTNVWAYRIPDLFF